MSIPLHLHQTAYKVLSTLIDSPQSRDDDCLLVAQIWSQETQATTLEEFLIELANGNLSNFDYIRRIRKKIQERHDNLQGECYSQLNLQEDVIDSKLTFFDAW